MSAISSTSVENRPSVMMRESDSAYVAPVIIADDTSRDGSLYRDKHVLLNAHELVLTTRTYPLASITSLRIRKIPTRKWPILLLAIIGVGVSFWLATYWLVIGAVGLVIIGLSILGLIASIKANYVLRISTAESEMDALMSNNGAYIQKVHDAIVQQLAAQNV